MNNPEYILVDVLKEIVGATKTALNIPVLNFQYGYIRELNETLIQWNASPQFAALKFPCIWLAQPFTINRNLIGFYGSTSVQLFILNHTDKNWKAEERMARNFKPVLYPIYRELLNQMNLGVAFSSDFNHSVTDRYYWGEEQKSQLDDTVDCIHISELTLELYDREFCLPLKS